MMQNTYKSRKGYLVLVTDSMLEDGPQNETLSEHRPHCKARKHGHPERCPFEKQAIRNDDSDVLSDEIHTENGTAGKEQPPWYEAHVKKFADNVLADADAMKLAARRYSLLSGDARFLNRKINSMDDWRKIRDWNVDLLSRGLQNAGSFEKFRFSEDIKYSDFEENAIDDIIRHQRCVDIINGADDQPIPTSKAGLSNKELGELSKEVEGRCWGYRDKTFLETAQGISAFYAYDIMSEAAKRYVADLDADGVENLRNDLRIVKSEGDYILLPPNRIRDVMSHFYETSYYLRTQASKEERDYQESLYVKQSQDEISGKWKCPPEDRKQVHGVRIKQLQTQLKDAIFKDDSPAHPEGSDAKHNGVTYQKCQDMINTFSDMPYEMVLHISGARPMFEFITMADAYCNDTNNISIGTDAWMFQPRTVAHECGHAVLHKMGQISNSQIIDKFKPIYNSLLEEYGGLLHSWGKDILNQDMANDRINTAEQFANVRNQVKRFALKKTLSPDEYAALSPSDLDCNQTDIGEYAALTDTLCAASNGELFCGHSKAYYRRGQGSCLHETVANITAALTLGWTTFPKLFPMTFEQVKKCVYGMN